MNIILRDPKVFRFMHQLVDFLAFIGGNDRLGRTRNLIFNRFRNSVGGGGRRRLENIIYTYAAKPEKEISLRIQELERQHQKKKNPPVVDNRITAVTLITLLLGIFVNKRWLVVTGLTIPFLLKDTVERVGPGWAMMKKLGLSSPLDEVEQEILILKTLRGDFDTEKSDTRDRVHRALAVIQAI